MLLEIDLTDDVGKSTFLFIVIYPTHDQPSVNHLQKMEHLVGRFYGDRYFRLIN